MIVAREKAEYYGLPESPAVKKQVRRRSLELTFLKKERIILTGLVFSIFCSCVVIAFYFAQILATGYAINTANQELSLLRTESHDLYTRVNQISSLGYIETVAVQKLGMVRPPTDQVVVVQSLQSPAADSPAAVPAQAVDDKPKAASSEHREENWVIKAFSSMVSRMEQSIHTG